MSWRELVKLRPCCAGCSLKLILPSKSLVLLPCSRRFKSHSYDFCFALNMFCKIQCIDITRFPLPAATSASPSKASVHVGVSASPVEFHDPNGKSGEPPSSSNLPNGGFKKTARFRKSFHPNGVSVLVEKDRPNPEPIVQGPDRDYRKSWVKPGVQSKSGGEVKGGLVGGRILKAGKMHTNCSTKWASYGGCLPSLLQALESTRDLDEALWPWKETITNKERSIILKEQSSWERALEIFQWFKRKGCYELNVIHYNIMLRILGKASRWVELERLWDEMRSRNIAPINSTYGTLIDVYSKGGLREKAVALLQRMNEQGMEPDEVTMGIVVQMYKKAGEFKMAEGFFKNWSFSKSVQEKAGPAMSTRDDENKASGAHLSLNSYTYNTLIDTYGKAGRVREASETFQQMLSNGVVPDTITLNSMLHMYGNHGRLEDASSLIQKMEELKCQPDTRTFNILISIYTRHDDINGAVNYFMKMKEASLEPDLVSYRTLLYALSIRHMVDEAEILILEMDEKGLEIDESTQSALNRMYIEAGLLEKSWSWFERFHHQGDMSPDCYAANIDAYGECGHIEEAERAFSCCQNQNKAGVVEYNVMIKAYGISKKYVEACRLFDSMKQQGLIPDRCTYVPLILMLADADLPHIAKPYLSKMQGAGLVNDCITYCAVIKSYTKLGQIDLALELYKEMIRYNVQPDVVVYGVLINAFTEAGNVEEALHYLETMKKSGISLNTVICKTLIKLYTKVGFLKEAEEIYELLKSSDGGALDVYSSNCMIDLYTERSMVKDAEDVFNSMQLEGIANEFSYAMMLCMYKRIGRLNDAIEIANKMRELGLVSELLSYNSVIGLFAMDGRFKEAVEVFEEMIRVSIQPDEFTFKSLASILLRSGVPKRAISKLDVARNKDAESGLKAWRLALSSVVGSWDDFSDVDY